MPAIRLRFADRRQQQRFERGAAGGPAAIRAALRSDRGNMASELGPEIGTDIAFTDDGDLPLTEHVAHDVAISAMSRCCTRMAKFPSRSAAIMR